MSKNGYFQPVFRTIVLKLQDDRQCVKQVGCCAPAPDRQDPRASAVNSCVSTHQRQRCDMAFCLQYTASDMWIDALFVLLLSGTIMYAAHPSGVTCQV